MTSPFTDEATQKFFENHKYFGLEANQVWKLHLINYLKVLISYFLYFFA
jgi:UDP-N-acetylglucosamine pyrophosphorylase